ncbi:MAG: hypothetical protein AAF483_08040 [Planctomycetota bacterium]
MIGLRLQAKSTLCFCTFFLALFAWLGIRGQVCAQGPKPIPPRAEQDTALKRIKQIFAAEYQSSEASMKGQLAKSLLDEVQRSTNETEQFSLYREAIQLAAEAGDARTALTAVAGMAKEFQVDAAKIRLFALGILKEKARSVESVRFVAQEFESIAQAFAAQGEFAQAERVIKDTQALLRRAKDRQGVERLAQTLRDLSAEKANTEAIQPALQKLRENPDDLGANGQVGRFECFKLAKWRQGLTKLAFSDDVRLAALAARTLSTQNDPEDQGALGDAWWSIAEADDKDRDAIRAFAVCWYRRALEFTAGLRRKELEQRILSVPVKDIAAAENRSTTINLIPLVDLKIDAERADRWKIEDDELKCVARSFVPRIALPLYPPAEYDLRLVYSQDQLRNGVGFLIPNPQHQSVSAVYVGEDRGERSGYGAVGDRDTSLEIKGMIRPGEKYEFVVRVRVSGITAFLNGRRIFVGPNVSRMKEAGGWHKLNNWQCIGVFCDDPTTFYALELKEVRGVCTFPRIPKFWLEDWP